MEKLEKRKLKEGEIIPIKEDYIFTEIFNKEENKYVLENFLSTYLNVSINEIRGNIKLLSRKLKKENKKEARNEVDVLLTLGKEVYNIELNNRKNEERNVVFASKIHSRNIKEGDREYYSMNKTIQINLNNYKSNREKLIETYYLRNEDGKKLTEKLQIDMVKAKEMCYSENEREEKIRKWCMAINAKTEEELKYYLGDLMSKDEKEKLVDEIKEMSVEEQYANIYIEAELHTPREEMIRNTELMEAKAEGIKEEKINTAKNMLQMNMKIEDISKVTGISIEGINNLIEN